MERASKVIRGLRLPTDTFSAEEVACGAWRSAVGKTIAAHTRAVHLVRTRLVIEVEDSIWQRQLNGLSRSVLRNLEKNLGAGLVEDLEFRVVPRRREPRRATAAMPATAADEAAGITDPVLRAIYQASRKKAQA
jgi:hypothetical protein